MSAPQLLTVFMAIHAVLWIAVPSLMHQSVPLDVAEGYGWGREWVVATYKHPAMPSWFLEASRWITGTTGWPAYVVSQAFVGITFALVYALGRELVDDRRAAAGVLLLSAVAFYAWPTVEFNHNTAQMPFWAGLPYVLWKAVKTRRAHWWVLLGLISGLSLYAKLSSVLLLGTAALWLLTDRQSRSLLRTAGPWMALLACAVVALPLARWLVAFDFAPLTYAAARADRAGGSLPAFLGSLVLNVGGLALLLWAVGLWRSKRDTDVVPEQERVVRFLATFTFGPLCLAILMALATRSGLRSAWGSSMFCYAGLLAVCAVGRDLSMGKLRQLGMIASVLSACVALGYAVVLGFNPYQRGAPMRANWPQKEISQRFVEIWQRETGTPLRLVGGGNWVAELVALTAPTSPSVYTGRSPVDSPWVSQQRIETQGVLFVWHATRSATPELVLPYLDHLQVKEERFPVHRWRKGEDVVVKYAVLKPQR